jgi:hypothetical protein
MKKVTNKILIISLSLALLLLVSFTVVYSIQYRNHIQKAVEEYQQTRGELNADDAD